MPDDRYPKQLLSQEWELKGRQWKTRCKVIDVLFHSLSRLGTRI